MPKRCLFCCAPDWEFYANNKTGSYEIVSEVQLTHHEIVNDLLLLQWNDESEHALPLKSMRDNCPCAACAGEKDVFGNVYKGPAKALTETSYEITGIQPVGYYALRPFWKDGHNTGIFSYDLLFSLANQWNS